MRFARNLWNDDSGQGLAEYALLLGLIVIGVVLFIQGMGGHIKNLFAKANNELTSADAAPAP
jgi:Flp pilus assembly pilin Flp